jgi:hypothetical protein
VNDRFVPKWFTVHPDPEVVEALAMYAQELQENPRDLAAEFIREGLVRRGKLSEVVEGAAGFESQRA